LLRLADREQKGTLMAWLDSLQQRIEPGEGMESEQRIEAVGHGEWVRPKCQKNPALGQPSGLPSRDSGTKHKQFYSL
jgi:hypothetical protein